MLWVIKQPQCRGKESNGKSFTSPQKSHTKTCGLLGKSKKYLVVITKYKLKWIFYFKGGSTLLLFSTMCLYVYRLINGIYIEVIIFRCTGLKIFYYTREKIYPEFDTL